MEYLLIALASFALGIIIGSVVESKYNKKLAMEAWRKERERFNNRD